MDCIHIVTETTVAIEKIPFCPTPSIPWFNILTKDIRAISLHFLHSCCKLSVAFKNKTRLGNAFQFKDCIPNDLTTGVSLSFNVDSAISAIIMNV